MLRFSNHIILIFYLIFLFSFSFSQEFNFRREVKPFPVADSSGQPYDLPFLGGMNRPVQQFVDIDGDSDPDLFVQDRADQLIFFRNSGTPANYNFEWVTDRFQDVQVGDWFKFADADNDGDFDLFVERPFGLIRYYRNEGSPGNPNLILAADTLTDLAGAPINVDAFSVPDWADIDCDQDLDLFLGRQTGAITEYLHIGLDPSNIPLYQFVTDTFQGLVILTGGGKKKLPETGDNISFHGANSLTFVDIDGDMDQDIFWGDFFAESVLYLENNGSCTEPEINITLEEYPPLNPLRTGGFNVPRFADIDADGDFDMFISVLGGSVSFITDRAENFYFYENNGSSSQPDFMLRTKQFIGSIDIGQNTIPAVADIDADGDLDLFLANQEDLHSPDHSNSRLHFFENTGSAGTPQFQLMDSNYLNYDKHFDLNYAPAFVDIDHDGDLDLFIGKWDGRITFYRNDGSAAAPDFERIDEFYGSIDVGNNAAPAFADLDGDGDFDLLIGEFSGNLNYYRNTGDQNSPNFQLEDENYFGIDAGDYSYPALADIDKDGDLDLFIGSDSSGTKFYRNTGTAHAAAFVPDTSFHLPKHLRTSPVFADLDNDGDLDMLSGSYGGGILYYENTGIPGGIDPEFTVNLPSEIHLFQNYPNPFNPTTAISFHLPENASQAGLSANSLVNLKIYDITGREVATLVSEKLAAGNYKYDWDAGGFASGIYMYQLRAGNFVQTRKLILLK